MLGGFGVLGPCKEDIGIYRDTWGNMGMYSDTHIYVYRCIEGSQGLSKECRDSGFRSTVTRRRSTYVNAGDSWDTYLHSQ